MVDRNSKAPEAPPTPISYAALRDGSQWTLVSAKDTRTTYVLEVDSRTMLTPGTHVRLLNAKTGKYAHVTCFWLTQGTINGRAYWEPPSEPVSKAA